MFFVDFSLLIVDYATVSTQDEPTLINSLWKQNRIGVSQKPSQNDAFNDVLIPSLIIISLLIVNACILFVIWRLRLKR